MAAKLSLQQVPNSSPEEIEYQHYHWKRFEFAFNLIQKINPKNALEIGPYVIAHNVVKLGIKIDTVGYCSEKIDRNGDHKIFDLDQIGRHPELIQTGDYDLVIACEVIEHLHLDLDLIYFQLNKLTKTGGIVLIQTPNAVPLKKRVAMLFGKNPFEMIRPEYRPGYGGHVREFTMSELNDYAKRNGFEVVEKYCENYFDYSHSRKAKLYFMASKLFPASWKDGIMLVLRKVSDPTISGS
ncbi:MAG: class I SAM-dependent methyltransferase [Ginsengibacter sp.]